MNDGTTVAMRSLRGILAAAILLLIPFQIWVSADSGFSMTDVDPDAVNVNVTLLTEEPQKRPIDCFAVSEDGSIAIGTHRFEEASVAVYTEDGTFLYGFRTEISGSFGLEWEGDRILLCLVRSDLAVTVNPSGEIERIRRIEKTTENNEYWHKSVLSAKREVGDKTYTIRNDMGILNLFASRYSQAVITDSAGNETVIYDVRGDLMFNMIAIMIGAILMFSIVGWLVIRSAKESRAKDLAGQENAPR